MMDMIRVDTVTGIIAIDTEVWTTKSKVVISRGSAGVQIGYGEPEPKTKGNVSTAKHNHPEWTAKALVDRLFHFSPL